MLLEIKEMTVHYGKSMAIQEVSLEIAERAVVSIIGANGAGKTTLRQPYENEKILVKRRPKD